MFQPHEIGPEVDRARDERAFICGTRKAIKRGPGDYRVVCATCDGGGTVRYPDASLAASTAIAHSNRPCPCRPPCGAE